MTDKPIDNRRPVGSDYFTLQHMLSSNNKLSHYLNKFNSDDYWIYKYSSNQKEVTYQELLDFKYAGYVFFKKSIYNKEHIDLWIKYIISIVGIKYLVKPLPPFLPEEKIEIRK